MTDFPVTERNQVRRQPKRAVYDRETVFAVIDEALICHAAFLHNGEPAIVPLFHARIGDRIYIHGSKSSRLLAQVQQGATVCLAFTIVDGLVLARSAFHHSINYRSVVLYGTGTVVENDEEKESAFEALLDRVAKGRAGDARKPDRKELDATAVIAVPIDCASAKMRSGPPEDAPEDYALKVWAGVIPVCETRLAPEDDPRLEPGIHQPPYLAGSTSRRP